MSRQPTVGGDTGAWGTVLNDYLSVEHNADGTLSGNMPASQGVVYVAGTGVTGTSGSDSNNGLSPGKPFATIAAAYASLPSIGGTLVLLNGLHDVGTGFVATSQKPAVVRSVSGISPQVYTAVTAGAATKNQPVIYSSTGAARLMTVGGPTGVENISKGWAFYGIGFDMLSATTITGIMALDLNHLRVYSCNSWGDGTTNKYMVRSDHPFFDDLSWYRLRDNYSRNTGLCYLNESGSGNCNNNQIQDNVLFGAQPWAIVLNNSQRSTVQGNNIEGGQGILYTGASHYNYTLWNGGESGGAVPYLQYDSSAWGNIHFNYGAIGGSGSSSPVVKDLCLANDSLGSFGSTSFVRRDADFYTITSNYTLTTGQRANEMFNMNAAGALTFTIPLSSSVGIGLGSTLFVRQGGAGQVTITPVSGSVTLRSRNGLKTAGQYAVVNMMKIGTNEWQVWGDTVV